ncbi:MAG: YeeE/YedE family protein [Sulfitobacter sp.]
MELDTVTAFTPIASLFGGVLIGVSAIMLMVFFGRVAGISGLSGTVVDAATGRGSAGDLGWQIAFLVGLIGAPLIYTLISRSPVLQTVPTSLFGMAAAGLIVGLGTAIGSGCTSGHGVCGLARLSPRSLVAVLTFIISAGITVFLLRHFV